MIAEIKLAWWREALERLDSAPPPAQPLLQALAAAVLPRGVSGAELAELEDGWLAVTAGETDDNPLQPDRPLWDLAERLIGGPRDNRPLLGLARLAERDNRRRIGGQPPEPRGSLIRQLILLRTVALGR